MKYETVTEVVRKLVMGETDGIEKNQLMAGLEWTGRMVCGPSCHSAADMDQTLTRLKKIWDVIENSTHGRLLHKMTVCPLMKKSHNESFNLTLR